MADDAYWKEKLESVEGVENRFHRLPSEERQRVKEACPESVLGAVRRDLQEGVDTGVKIGGNIGSNIGIGVGSIAGPPGQLFGGVMLGMTGMATGATLGALRGEINALGRVIGGETASSPACLRTEVQSAEVRVTKAELAEQDAKMRNARRGRDR